MLKHLGTVALLSIVAVSVACGGESKDGSKGETKGKEGTVGDLEYTLEGEKKTGVAVGFWHLNHELSIAIIPGCSAKEITCDLYEKDGHSVYGVPDESSCKTTMKRLSHVYVNVAVGLKAAPGTYPIRPEDPRPARWAKATLPNDNGATSGTLQVHAISKDRVTLELDADAGEGVAMKTEKFTAPICIAQSMVADPKALTNTETEVPPLRESPTEEEYRGLLDELKVPPFDTGKPDVAKWVEERKTKKAAWRMKDPGEYFLGASATYLLEMDGKLLARLNLETMDPYTQNESGDNASCGGRPCLRTDETSYVDVGRFTLSFVTPTYISQEAFDNSLPFAAIEKL
jgi:hypothetical protein